MPGVPVPKRLRHANRPYHSRKARRRTRLEAMLAYSQREDTLGDLADHIVSEKYAAKEERPMCAERAILVRQAALRYAIAGILGLIEDTVTALVTLEGHEESKRPNNRL